MDTNTQLLHSINAKLASLDTRMCAIEAKVGESHAFIQPKADVKGEAGKGKAGKGKPKTAPKVKSLASKAHHAMKAKLKALPKEVQKSFTGCWMALREDAGYGSKGNIPAPVYFELQMQAYKEVA
tara:strand:+ start:227 stop:601 length:375 start_codon:yes stop_codon:yes gene_type:complete